MENKKEFGFTLIELIVVMSMISIMAAIAVPAYLQWLPDMHLKGAIRDLYSNLQNAKLQAVKDNRSVSVRFNTGANPGFYYFDLNNDTVFTAGEFRVDLSVYKDVTFGAGNAAMDWNNTAIAQAAIITFSSTGTANSGSLFLTNTVNPARCFSVTSQISGSLKLREYPGTLPFNQNNWN